MEIPPRRSWRYPCRVTVTSLFSFMPSATDSTKMVRLKLSTTHFGTPSSITSTTSNAESRGANGICACTMPSSRSTIYPRYRNFSASWRALRWSPASTNTVNRSRPSSDSTANCQPLSVTSKMSHNKSNGTPFRSKTCLNSFTCTG